MSRVLGANPSAHVPVLPAAGSSAAALCSSCLHTSAPADERCRRLLSSWFRHVGELAVLAAGPKHQNKGCGCVISLHAGERRAVNPLAPDWQTSAHVKNKPRVCSADVLHLGLRENFEGMTLQINTMFRGEYMENVTHVPLQSKISGF